MFYLYNSHVYYYSKVILFYAQNYIKIIIEKPMIINILYSSYVIVKLNNNNNKSVEDNVRDSQKLVK